MKDEAMIVLTAQAADRVLAAGGTKSWVLDRAHAKRCRHVVLCQNAKTDWGDGKEPHGKAFMVGVVDDVVPAPDKKDRWLVTFSAYAEIDMPGAWAGWRNPVRYTALDELGIDPGKLKFRPMPPAEDEPSPRPDNSGNAKGLTIAEAKQALARTFGVTPDAVEITIRG
ncbi:MAG: hypothetical protein JNM30_14035 [Rhodospirillales bacterium]|nr:hypothetical protein [Rhodospirillales bacterium]